VTHLAPPWADAWHHDYARTEALVGDPYGDEPDRPLHPKTFKPAPVLRRTGNIAHPAASASTNQDARNGGDAPALTQPADPRLLPGASGTAVSAGSAAVRVPGELFPPERTSGVRPAPDAA
jgi:hypothetical protein